MSRRAKYLFALFAVKAALAAPTVSIPRRTYDKLSHVVGVSFEVSNDATAVRIEFADPMHPANGNWSTWFACQPHGAVQRCNIGLYLSGGVGTPNSHFTVKGWDGLRYGAPAQEANLSCTASGGTGCPSEVWPVE